MKIERDASLSAAQFYSDVYTDILKSVGKLLLRRHRRVSSGVMAEYDQGRWRQRLEERTWEKVPSIEALVRGQDDHKTSCIIDGRACVVSSKDYYEYRANKLASSLRAICGDESEIVELGCGWGINLLALSRDPKWGRLLGFDISPNATKAADLIASHFGLSRAKFGILDLLDSKSPNWSEIEGRTAFTHFCLEQLPNSLDRVIENILTSRPLRVVHFEMSSDVLTYSSIVDISSVLHVMASDYQHKLLAVLREFESKGKVRVLKVERQSFAPKLRNLPTLIVWEPVTG